MTTDADTFFQENLNGYPYEERFPAWFSSFLLTGYPAALFMLRMIHYYLTNSQMMRLLKMMYQEGWNDTSSITAFQDAINGVRDYQELLRTNQIDDLNLEAYNGGGSFGDMMRSSIEQYDYGDDRRLDIILGMLIYQTLLVTDDAYFTIPQWEGLTMDQQYKINTMICKKEPDCGYIDADETFLTAVMPPIMDLINEYENS